jgi:hypothetical protein
MGEPSKSQPRLLENKGLMAMKAKSEYEARLKTMCKTDRVTGH